jgi:hypothetical protein
MDTLNLKNIRESFGKIVYSHKTHEKAAEMEYKKNKIVKWINIILLTLTSLMLTSTVITNEGKFLYIGAILSALSLGFMIFQLSFDCAKKAEDHSNIAKELWYLREKYVNFITDTMNEKIDEHRIITKRNQLIKELKFIYKFAPQTNSKAYQKARKALKIKEELTFSDQEIDNFLPENLRIEK